MKRTLTQHQHRHCDILIIGCGAAGLSLAAKLPETLKIFMLAKTHLQESSSYWAQGGIAAAVSDEDSIENHIQDTINTGAGLCVKEVVTAVIKQGTDTISWLRDTVGIRFSSQTETSSETLALGQEGGHSHRRIVHSDDKTGQAIQEGLVTLINSKSNVTVLQHFTAVDLITNTQQPQKKCLGAYVLNKDTGKIESIVSQITILATGGAGKVYLYTSNPDSASGDGIAIAWRAGCRIANMEFMQFHPTCLYHPTARSFLLSEALRGEGAKLVLPNGKRFMQSIDPRGELAPRDTVARAIDENMKCFGLDHVWLDISHQSKKFLQQRFPYLYQKCLDYGYDMAQQPIPVVPAAHYTCGGIMVDIEGRSDILNLYAIGETAHTGLHGANRMASNSLLECIVFAEFVARSITRRIADDAPTIEVSYWDESRVTESAEKIMIAHNWHELRQIMWNYVGIVRTQQRLTRAKQRLAILKAEVDDYYNRFIINNDLIELRNLVCVAELILDCALSRHESRGLHYIKDYPETNRALDKINTVMTPPNFSSE